MYIAKYDFFRFCSFLVLTVMEIGLAVFLLYYGNELSKPFAVALLILQLFSLHRIYAFVTNMLLVYRN